MDSYLPPFKVFSGTKSRYMAEEICKELGVELGSMKIEHFADGEFEVSFEESVRGCEVYLVQSTFPNCDNLMELLLMIDAAKRASAKSVIAVMPYFGWARQDRKDKPRVSIAAKLVSDMLVTAGVDRVITMDLHADPNPRVFQCACRPPLCLVGVHPIHTEPQALRHGDSNSRRGRCKASQQLCQVS